MKVCVFGPGAVGGHLAGLLADSGVDVSVVARGAALQAMRRDGIVLRLDDREVTARVRASDTPSELGPQDLVFVTVKTTALAQVAATIAPLLGPDTPVVFVMNGIPWWYFHAHGGANEGRRMPRLDPGDALWNAVGPQRAIAGIAMSACTVLAPGVVEVKGGNRMMTVGEPDGSLSPRLRQIAGLLKNAGFPVEASERIRDSIWAKLMLNLGSGPMAVLAPAPLMDLYAEPACVAARGRATQEVAAIAAAMGCHPQVDLDAQLAAVRASPHIPSIAQDALKGRPLEIDTMFLQPLEMARECGVPTPTLDLLLALVMVKARAAGLYER
ncbi:MAG: 2-dehydropantoate 2-reductase [Rhizobacter sp.]|nr:2-dehydropantoate 2-reductase [Rhizobacter sp.]